MTIALAYSLWRLCCPMTCAIEERYDSTHADKVLNICAARPSGHRFEGSADEFCGCKARMCFER
jgi:hypothetical protein